LFEGAGLEFEVFHLKVLLEAFGEQGVHLGEVEV
jgi:hypothetical protein